MLSPKQFPLSKLISGPAYTYNLHQTFIFGKKYPGHKTCILQTKKIERFIESSGILTGYVKPNRFIIKKITENTNPYAFIVYILRVDFIIICRLRINYTAVWGRGYG